jgi:hypothetical protein
VRVRRSQEAVRGLHRTRWDSWTCSLGRFTVRTTET